MPTTGCSNGTSRIHVIDAEDERAPGLLEAARSSAIVLDRRILRVLDAETRDGLCYVVNEWGSGISLDILVAAVRAARPAALGVAGLRGGRLDRRSRTPPGSRTDG